MEEVNGKDVSKVSLKGLQEGMGEKTNVILFQLKILKFTN